MVVTSETELALAHQFSWRIRCVQNDTWRRLKPQLHYFAHCGISLNNKSYNMISISDGFLRIYPVVAYSINVKTFFFKFLLRFWRFFILPTFLPSHAIACNGIAIVWRLSVCPSVCDVDGLWSHTLRWNFITGCPVSSLAVRKILAI